MFDLNFYKGKRVLVTGHTGFKGTWLCRLLYKAGAEVYGYSLEPSTAPSLYELVEADNFVKSYIGDIRDFDNLKNCFDEIKPEIVFHLAAQPIVREGYANPRYTYETNVMGTVNLFECVRLSNTVKSVLNVTTDKVYKNDDREQCYKENEMLDGFDPYSNSKSCSELVSHCYNSSFLSASGVAVSTARAGNVIGGGDFANSRIIPHCISEILGNRDIIIRNPYSVRPYQHVLESVCVYLMIAAKQSEDLKYADYYNVGPDDCDCYCTGELVDLFCRIFGEGAKRVNRHEEGPHEADFLKLDCSKLKSVFDWTPIWRIETVIEKTVEWTKEWIDDKDILLCMDRQIEEFLRSASWIKYDK